MKSRNLLIILIVLFISVCVCPVLFAIIFTIIDNMEPGSISEALSTLFLLVLCIIPILLAFAAVGLQIINIIRSPKAARHLAAEINLQPLNEAPKVMGVWYGGLHAHRRIAIKPFGSTYRTYSDGSSRRGLRYYLRLVMAVQVDRPLGLRVLRPANDAGKNPADFAQAFQVENGDKLAIEVQEALLAFIHKGYRAGFQGVNLRLSKGLRNLYLIDRSAVQEGLLAPEVLLDARVILIHDHPEANIGKETLLDLLDDMAEVAQVIENKFSDDNPHKRINSL